MVHHVQGLPDPEECICELDKLTLGIKAASERSEDSIPGWHSIFRMCLMLVHRGSISMLLPINLTDYTYALIDPLKNTLWEEDWQIHKEP